MRHHQHADPSARNYPETVLNFADGTTVDLRRRVRRADRAALADLGLTGEFAILTAHNPRERIAPPEENRRREEELLQELRTRGATWRMVSGESLDGMHQETSVAVALPLEEVHALACKLEQSAFFWFDGRSFSIRGALADMEVPLPPRGGGPDKETDRSRGRRRVAARLVAGLSAEERTALEEWLNGLLEISSLELSRHHKLRVAVRQGHRLGIPAILGKQAVQRILKTAWTERSWPVRVGSLVAIATVGTSGSQAAGIAAFGTAISVPLWVLFGGGATAATAILTELGRVAEREAGRGGDEEKDGTQTEQPAT